MHAPAIPKKDAASLEKLKPACQILILHEDFPPYSRAVEICRRIMERFASELDFDIKCWNFIELVDPNCARHAAKTAGSADIILLSTRAARLPHEVDRWLDLFFAARFRPSGVLALLLDVPETPRTPREDLDSRLAQLAARLGMDFIPLLSSNDAALIIPPKPGGELQCAP